jgi:hypothetical protein
MNATNDPIVPAPAPVPAPGVYKNVPFATYRAWPAVNKSTLDHIQDGSPKHCRYRMDNPEKQTTAMLVGRAYHTLALEGEEAYGTEFKIAGRCSAVTKKGSQCTRAGEALGASGAWFCKQHSPDDALDPTENSALKIKDDELVRALRRGTLDCEDARKFLGSPGDNEVSVLWVDAETGLPCKARDRHGAADVEQHRRPEDDADAGAGEDTSPGRWRPTATQRRRPSTCAAARAVGHPLRILLASSPSRRSRPTPAPPTGSPPTPSRPAKSRSAKLLRIYAQCQSSGEWYGYPGGFEEITIPRYAMRRIVEEATA